MKNKKIKLVYVLGPAYSGSTLLGLALGKHQQIINLGEIVNLENDYSTGTKCTCGELVQDCEFWNTIKNGLAALQTNWNFTTDTKRETIDKRGGIRKLWTVLVSVRFSFLNSTIRNYSKKMKAY